MSPKFANTIKVNVSATTSKSNHNKLRFIWTEAFGIASEIKTKKDAFKFCV